MALKIPQLSPAKIVQMGRYLLKEVGTRIKVEGSIPVRVNFSVEFILL